MAIDERRRHELYRWAQEAMGPERADTLMELLPPVGWADVATKDDVRVLGRELRGEIAELRGELLGEIGGLRGEMGALRGELRGELGSLEGCMEAALRRQTYWLGGLVTALWTATVGVVAIGG